MVARFSEYAALPLRFVLGALFIALGARMVLGDSASTATAWTWWAGLVELIGGLALVLGVLTRWVALALALESLIFVAARASGVPVDVEFRLAALAGLQVDNCEVAVDAPEIPGFDGSSWPIVQALEQAGIASQSPPRPRLIVQRPIWVEDQSGWVKALPGQPGESWGGLSVHYQLDYGPQGPIGRETLTLAISPENFRQHLAAARTFILKAEAQWLQDQGLGRRTSPRDLLVFDDQGPIDNQLRFPDECVRHKVLDLIGDLALAGCDLVGHIVAYRSGHRLNARLVERLLAQWSRASACLRLV